MNDSIQNSVVLKSKEGPVVTTFYKKPLDETVRSTEFDLSNPLAVMMFVMTLNLAGRIGRLIEDIEAENQPSNVLTVDFSPTSEVTAEVPVEVEAPVATISLKEIVRRSMGELTVDDPTQYVDTIVQALIAVLTSGEATTVTY